MESKSSYLDQYKIIKTLGEGHYAKVKLALSPNQNYVAIKRFNSNTANIETLKHQLKILQKLHHPNLINLISVRQNALYKKKNGSQYNCLAIILQYAGGGQLFDFVADSGHFSQIVARTYFTQFIKGLQYMHKEGFSHRDLKPENILLTSDFTLKIADFGFTTLLIGKDNTGILHTVLGTPGYMAPEIKSKNYKGTQIDIFAAGVILFIMCTALPPFVKTFPMDKYYLMIKQKKYEDFWSEHARRKKHTKLFTNQFKDLVQRMLAYDTKQRIKIQQIKQHAWLKQKLQNQQQLIKEFSKRKLKVDDQIQKRRIKRLKQKQQRSNAIFLNQKFTRGETEIVDDFLLNYKSQYEQIQLPLKLKTNTYDIQINSSGSYLFGALITYLKKPIHLSNDQIIFKAQIEMNKNTLEVVFTELQQQIKIKMRMQVFVIDQEKICLSINHLEGNQFYFRLLFKQLKLEFAQNI